MTDTEQQNPDPPPGLGLAGRRFWTDVNEEWELRPDELRICERACHVLDTLESLDAMFTGDDAEPPTTIGSRGQLIVHPALVERRQQELVLAALIRQLGLVEDDSEEARRSAAGRALARQRWDGGPTRRIPRGDGRTRWRVGGETHHG